MARSRCPSDVARWLARSVMLRARRLAGGVMLAGERERRAEVRGAGSRKDPASTTGATNRTGANLFATDRHSGGDLYADCVALRDHHCDVARFLGWSGQ